MIIFLKMNTRLQFKLFKFLETMTKNRISASDLPKAFIHRSYEKQHVSFSPFSS